MQKVVGSSPIIRLEKSPGNLGFSYLQGGAPGSESADVNPKCQLDAALASSRCPKPAESRSRVSSACRARSNMCA